MKQYQIVIRRADGTITGILNKGILFKLNAKDIPEDAGYDTLGAAKRIATLINKDQGKSAGLVQTEDIKAEVMSQDEIATAATQMDKDFTRNLMLKYYPEQEQRIQDEAERAKAEAAVGGTLTDEEWAEVKAAKAANAKAQPKPVKVKAPKAPKAPKEPKAKPEKDPFFITDLQRKFLDLMRQDNFYEHGLDSALWTPILADTLESLGMNKMTTGAMISTLREKGMMVVGENEWMEVGSKKPRKMKFCALTELGKEVMRREGFAE